MRRRTLKKWVLRCAREKNLSYYRQASSRGSRKHARRWRIMCRYLKGWGTRVERHRQRMLRLHQLEQDLKKSNCARGIYRRLAEEIL